jgi:hypothetical protein
MLGFDFHHKSLDFAPRLNVFGFLPHSPSSSTSLHCCRGRVEVRRFVMIDGFVVVGAMVLRVDVVSWWVGML